MKLYRFLTLLTLVTVSLACIAFAQAPTITTIGVKDTGCFYKVGSKPCSIGPGMTVNINGSNFGGTWGRDLVRLPARDHHNLVFKPSYGGR